MTEKDSTDFEMINTTLKKMSSSNVYHIFDHNVCDEWKTMAQQCMQ